MHRVRFKDLGSRPGCAHMHVTRLRPRQSSTPHTQDFFELFLVLEGGGTHHYNRRKFTLETGHLVAIRPNDSHWFSTEAGQTLVFVNVAVSAAWWRAYHTLRGLPAWVDKHGTTVLSPQDTRRLDAELSGVGVTEEPLAVVRALDRAREHLTLDAADRSNDPPIWLVELRQELAAKPEALGEPIAFWQRRSGRSPEHLARSCRRFYGVTFSELINQARVERAKYLLRTTDEKVIAIAYDCGFGNLANFHRNFARMTGRTPGHWRRGGSATVPVHS